MVIYLLLNNKEAHIIFLFFVATQGAVLVRNYGRPSGVKFNKGPPFSKRCVVLGVAKSKFRTSADLTCQIRMVHELG